MAPRIQGRPAILATSVAAIAVTGALYGAGLRIRRQQAEKSRTELALTPNEHIEHLQIRQQELLDRRAVETNLLKQVEDKIAARRPEEGS